MTVQELIALLQEHPKEARVVVNGYEGGYCDVGEAVPLPIRLNVNSAWYYGPHENVYPDDSEAADEVAVHIR